MFTFDVNVWMVQHGNKKNLFTFQLDDDSDVEDEVKHRLREASFFGHEGDFFYKVSYQFPVEL